MMLGEGWGGGGLRFPLLNRRRSCSFRLSTFNFEPSIPSRTLPYFLTSLLPYFASLEFLLMTQQLTFNLMPERKTFTVSELTGKIRDLLVKNLTDISVKGEISNCREAQSGHIYFTLTDDRAQVRCVYFT